MSLRSRLALVFGLLALCVSAAVSLSAFQSTGAELRSSTDEFLANRAAEVASGLRVTPEGRRPQQGRNNGNNPNNPDGSQALPFDPDSIVQSLGIAGQVTGTSGGDLPVSDETMALALSRPGQGAVPASLYEDITIDGSEYRMYVVALRPGGAVQVARSTTENDAVLGDLVVRFVFIGLVASLVAVIAGWLVARQMTKPLRRLTRVAADVANTRDFSTQVAVDRSDEIGQLAGSFQQMLAALETSREQQHRLVRDAGHELRTPLTSLRANVELLERARALPEEAQVEVLGAIRAELGELTNLFNELMELATDTRDADVPMEPLDLREVIDRTVERWQVRTDRKIDVIAVPAFVSTESSTGAPERGQQSGGSIVHGNAAMLERALTNLLGNANKFSPAHTAIEVIADGGMVAVRDHGPGVPVADRERIFDRFFRSDLTRTMPGSGLGLAIVSQIVERHGGTVWAGEAPGGGAEIGFKLPILAHPSHFTPPPT